jgi:hypothetical protein
LFGAKPDKEHRRDESHLPQQMSAAEVLQKVVILQQTSAQWPEIWQSLNPDCNREAERLLVELRGPHLLAPHVGLNVLEDGCRRALAANPNADRFAALQSSLKTGDPFVRPD